MDQIKKLQDFGYEVELFLEDPAVWSVSGYGISLQLREDDEDAWKRLANPKAHESRKAQYDDPQLDDKEKQKLDLEAQVSLGDIKQKEADKILGK